MATHKHNQGLTQSSLPSERSERGGGSGRGTRLQSTSHLNQYSLPSKRSERGPGPGRGTRLQSTSHLNPPASSRRGVILLVLLGMLALFGATAFAFVVIASHAKQTSEALKKVDRVMFSPRQDLDEAMRQVLRGPKDTNLRSVLRHHSLLEDVYGDGDDTAPATIGGWVINEAALTPSDGSTWVNPKIPGKPGNIGPEHVLFPPKNEWPMDASITGPTNVQVDYALDRAGGQIIDFIAGYTIPANQPVFAASWPYTKTAPLHLDPPDDPLSADFLFGQSGEQFRRRVGCVLTITDPDSALYNKSTRIVGYWRHQIRDTSAPYPVQIVYHRYQVLAFEGVSAAATVNYFKNTQSKGFNYIINGAPFSGTGAGYDPHSRILGTLTNVGTPPVSGTITLEGHGIGPGDVFDLYWYDSAGNLVVRHGITCDNTNVPAAPPVLNEVTFDNAPPASGGSNLPPLNTPVFAVKRGTQLSSYRQANYLAAHRARYRDGIDWTPTTPRPEKAYPFALLPNPTDPLYHYQISCYANEDYDAPDFQNMLLAMEFFDGTAMNMPESPSLHRPALARYWVYQLFNEMTTAGIAQLDAWRALAQPYGMDGLPNTSDESVTPPWANLIVNTKRRCLMRPLTEDHRFFTGSNDRWSQFVGVDLSGWTLLALQDAAERSWGAIDPDYNDLPPWDVDNDGDGLPDSVWVDIGLPVRSLPDGRKVKPLVAVHCIDLDGKINLNTAGSVEQLHHMYRQCNVGGAPVAQLRSQQYDEVSPPGYCPNQAGTQLFYAQDLPQDPIPCLNSLDVARGQGCGPADMSLFPLFYNIATGTNDQRVNAAMNAYRTLLLGNPYAKLDGRYGEIRFRDARSIPLPDANDYRRPAAGSTSSATAAPEQILTSRLFGFPTNYFSAVMRYTESTHTPATGYGSPLDLKGTLATGLDFFGQPIYTVTQGLPVAAPGDPSNVVGWNTMAWNQANLNTPYELKLGAVAPEGLEMHADLDNPFTIAEQEALLRRYDADVLRLPGRLRRLLNAGPRSPYRYLTTTQSWDMPVPNLAMPKELRDVWDTYDVGSPCNISDLIATKAEYNRRKNNVLNWLPGGGPVVLSYPAMQMGGGQAMQIDVTSLLSPEVLQGLRMDLNCPFGNGRDDNSNGLVDEITENEGFTLPNGQARYENARYEYARTLYTLMMALVDQAWFPAWDEEYQRELGLGGGGAPPGIEEVKARARARAIAQWAVNVVDARDSDSIMTPFEYDVYPFAMEGPPPPAGNLIQTWNVNGVFDPQNDPNDPLYNANFEPYRGVVWGCERPELLITETLAFHDRGTDDTSLEVVASGTPGLTTDPAPDTDEDFDQVFRPEGSFFVELYNPWGETEPGPRELYSERANAGGVLNPDYGVQLDKLTPGNAALNKYRSPVWRLAITKAPAGNYRDPEDDYLWQNFYAPVSDKWDRLVYFTPNNYSSGDYTTTELVRDPADSQAAVLFFPSNANSTVDPIRPESYAVVGPGDPFTNSGVTRIGEVRHYNDAASQEPVGSLRRIVLNHNGNVNVFPDGQNDVIADLVNDGDIKPPKGIVIDTVLDPGDALDITPVKQRRLSVSEPAGGYAADTPIPGPGGTYNPATGYVSPYPVLDVPEGKPGPSDPPDGEWIDLSGAGFGPLATDGTTPLYRYTHLQRLADPNQPYDALTNPYITIDTSPVDLTVFNTAQVSPSDDPDVRDPVTGEDIYAFRSRQRGDPIAASLGAAIEPGPQGSSTPTPQNFWAALVRDQNTDPFRRDFPVCKLETPLAGGVVSNHAFVENFAHTLGFLNEFFFDGDAPVAATDPQYFGRPLDPDEFGILDPDRYRGAPGTKTGTDFAAAPFPWLNWLNRPFANSHELMFVPAVRQSRFLVSYNNQETLASPSYYMENQQYFGHLLNFFGTVQGTAQEGPMMGSYFGLNGTPLAPGIAGAPETGPQLYRLFEYVQVPSRFVDAQTRANPTLAAQPKTDHVNAPYPPPPINDFWDQGYATVTSVPGEDHAFYPPRHHIPAYREPGKINLNTLNSAVVLNCLGNDHIDYDDTTLNAWNAFANARRAYTGTDVSIDTTLPPLPTRSANPFRSFAGVDLTSPLPGRDTASDNPATGADEFDPLMPDIVKAGVNATCSLRAVSATAATAIDNLNPLFGPTFGNTSVNGTHSDYDQNPFFRYQSLQRLSNLVTTRSNVYAVWITVGYFEAEKFSDYQPTSERHKQVYHDGYTFGHELGIDTGDVVRHRAFYVIDRSVPVGFIPGEDLNTEKAILLRRFIE